MCECEQLCVRVCECEQLCVRTPTLAALGAAALQPLLCCVWAVTPGGLGAPRIDMTAGTGLTWAVFCSPGHSPGAYAAETQWRHQPVACTSSPALVPGL